MADETTQTNNEATSEGVKQPVPSRVSLYAKLSKLSPKAFAQLETLLESKNESVRLGAVNTVLDRLIPKLKLLELNNGESEDGTKQPFQLLINAGSGFIPATITLNASPKGSDLGESKEIQDTDLAQKSQENNDSDIRDGETGSSS